jgi:hypothetical protein
MTSNNQQEQKEQVIPAPLNHYPGTTVEVGIEEKENNNCVCSCSVCWGNCLCLIGQVLFFAVILYIIVWIPTHGLRGN